MSQRKTHTAEFKAKVALEAIRGEKTSSQIASQYQVHPAQISQWKKQLLEHSCEVFRGSGKHAKRETGPSPEELYSQIGQMKVEIDWMKKKAAELERYQ